MTKGLTLLEVLVASGIATVVGIFLVSILVNNSGVFYQQDSIVNSGLGLNDSLRRIDENIRQAATVAGGYPEISPTYTSGPGALVLKLPAINESGIINNVYDYVVIAKDGNNPKILRLQVFPDASYSTRPALNTVLTTILQSIQFDYTDKNGNVVSPNIATSVGVNMTLLSKTGSVGEAQSSSIITSLRNTQQ